MSRHSKWSKIKRQKEVSDQKRGMVFTKLANAITIAARHGQSDPEMNFKLRMAVDQARAVNMPKDNIERAIARAKGVEGQALEHAQFEIIGPGGVGIIVMTTTDNHNRTVGSIKSTLKEHGASLAGPHAVAWQFALRGHIIIPLPTSREEREKIELTAIDAGGIDIGEEDDVLVITTAPEMTEQTKRTLAHAGMPIQEMGIGLVPTVSVSVTDEAVGHKLDALIAALEEIEEVDEVVTNAA